MDIYSFLHSESDLFLKHRFGSAKRNHRERRAQRVQRAQNYLKSIYEKTPSVVMLAFLRTQEGTYVDLVQVLR